MNNIIHLITGAAIAIITSFFNNKFQLRRDIIKFENDRKIEIERREFEKANSIRLELLKTIEKIHELLNYFKDSISLTSSVIDSSNGISCQEFNMIHKKELKQFRNLKSIIQTRFPNLLNNILRIEGHHSNYWGNQNLLLGIDASTNFESYQIIQKKLIEIADKASSEIYDIQTALVKSCEMLNR